MRPAISLASRFCIAILLLACLSGVPGSHAQDSLNSLVPPTPPPPPGQTAPGHVLKSNVDLVVLHVTVADAEGQLVPDLHEDSFRVFENNVEQKVSFFSRADIPVTMGLVIDNSASMREKRAQVNAAALTFVRTSNPQDEAFVVNFNDEYYLDTEHDFTSDINELNDALSRIEARAGTALYDAVIGSLGHIKKGHKDKRVLLIVTDGEDNLSRNSFEETIHAAQQSSATIYAVGVFSEEDLKHDKKEVRHAKKALTELAEATGGQAYFPPTLDEVTPTCERVAREIRSQYTLGYYPTNTAKDGTFRTVRVQVQSHHGKVSVRSRAGYYAPAAPASAD